MKSYLNLLSLLLLLFIVTACGKTNIKPIVDKADKMIEDEKITDAIIYYQKQIQKHPKEPVLYLNQAALFRKQQKFPHAIRNYRVVLRLNPESFWPYIGLARVYMAQKKLDKALAVLKSGQKELPKNGPILFYLGRVYYDMGIGTQAVEYFNLAIDAQYPKLYDIYYYRGMTFEHLLKNKDRAKLDYESYVMMDGPDKKDEVKKKLEALKGTQYNF